MDEIKSVLTDEQIADLANKDSSVIHFARAIERAVLEAAPASSAMAMQPVDAKDVIDAERWRHCLQYGFPWLVNSGWRAPLPTGQVMQCADAVVAVDSAMLRVAALQSSQPSTVQAIDAGSQS